ncbi:MAG: tRNA (adenosine(37)-N6)-threonylcarbamoyltransferase complex dimerization subunit type 1 TsaB [Myxococcales bacterium]|nr:tRNA (adenosine(37)-N6)-threonylcarbamoyltransferase complex dimerization subunit type 1 TsaB [Myxococcales bacterium]
MSSASGSPPDEAAGAGWYLAFDASTPRTAIALGTIDRHAGAATLRLEFADEDGANQTSTWLVDRLRALTDEVGVALRDLRGIAVGRGPGTFTGTRVAVATCQGLALGLDCPCFPLSTLAAVAGDGEPGETILALLDARRREVYAGLYALDSGVEAPRLRRLCDDRCAPLTAVLDDLTGTFRAVGPGVRPYADALPADAMATSGASPRGLWRATVAAVLDSEGVHPRALEASYLRRSYAELGVNTPKRPMIRSPFVD